jgi:16S rRNA (uracil1498-N3)-methyltransferase
MRSRRRGFAARARFVLDDRAAPGEGTFAGLGAGDYVLAVGPEGGWSDAERKRLGEAGVVAVALGTRVLRAETAVYAGLAVIQHRIGDLR